MCQAAIEGVLLLALSTHPQCCRVVRSAVKWSIEADLRPLPQSSSCIGFKYSGVFLYNTYPRLLTLSNLLIEGFKDN